MGESDTTGYLLFLLGTGLCLLGFLRWPQSSLELMRPRFVVPGVIWGVLFLQWILPREIDDRFTTFVEHKGNAALAFTCLCLLCFWIGFALPLGRSIGRSLTKQDTTFVFNPDRFLLPGFFLSLAAFALQFLMLGTNIFELTGSPAILSGLPTTVLKIGNVAVDIFATAGAALIGLGWPAKGRRSPFVITIVILGLLLGTHVYLGQTSRGTPLVIFTAFAAASFRHRRVNWVAATVLAFLVVTMVHAALTVRPVYGNQSGSLNFMRQYFSVTLFAWPEVVVATARAPSALDALTVTMVGVETKDIGELPPLTWFANQIPVPRFLGLPEWTMDASKVLSRAKKRFFTVSMYGDLYAHFGYWGSILFSVVGVAYRFVDTLTASGGALELGAPTALEPLDDPSGADPSGRPTALGAATRAWAGLNAPQSLNIYLLFLFTSYGAFLRGSFNTYRTWVVSFTYPLYILVIAVALIRIFRRDRSEGWGGR